jgi:hypothetical protein
VVSNGLDLILNVMFRSTSAITTWYLGLVDNAGFSTFAATDTISSGGHPGWNEVSSGNVGNTTRPQWIPAAPGSPNANSIVNSSAVAFNMTPTVGTTITIKGLFLVSDSTWGGTAGTLFSTASFQGGTQAVNNGDVLKVTYTVSASNNPANI